MRTSPGRHRGEQNYIDLLAERVELASKTAQSLFDRVTSQILAGAAKKSAAARKSAAGFTVVPPPAADEKPSRVSRRSDQKGEPNGQKEGAAATNGFPAGTRIKNGNGKREYLLLVEDEPDVADVASDMLADEGYRVVIAHDGFEALKIYEQMGKQIGLVILDYFLPVIDGDAVFEELRTHQSGSERGAQQRFRRTIQGRHDARRRVFAASSRNPMGGRSCWNRFARFWTPPVSLRPASQTLIRWP